MAEDLEEDILKQKSSKGIPWKLHKYYQDTIEISSEFTLNKFNLNLV